LAKPPPAPHSVPQCWPLQRPASAAIVCSGNVCWHTHEAYDYPPDSKVIVHEDNWKWGPTERFSFREHEGRGYWHGDKWTTW
jgi:hypothetical protein